VARYNPNGTLDTTFGNSGEMIIDVGESLYIRPTAGTANLALSGDKIDLVGEGYLSGNDYIVQLTAAGQLDKSFGPADIVKLGQGSWPSLAVQSDGKLVVASSAPFDIHLTRLLANGSPDAGFATGGTATLSSSITRSITGENLYPRAVKVDPLGRYVIGGLADNVGGISDNFMVIRLTSAGTLDSTFGNGGIGTSGNLGTLNLSLPVAMALQPDGKALLVGSELNTGKFAAVRFTGDSALLAASLPQHASSARLTVKEAQPLLTEAEAIWRAAGVDTSTLGAIDIHIADLGGTILGLADEVHHAIWLDDNAAAWGWFVDKTPWYDSEFTTPGNQGEQNRMDLLRVLEPEKGHLLGKEHEAAGVLPEALAPGTRVVPGGGHDWLGIVDRLFVDDLFTGKKHE
jgi:uncharacterized delta-60 repeat protein